MRVIVAVISALVLAGCASAGGDASPTRDQFDSSTTQPETTTTTEPVNRPPDLRVVETARAEIGQRLTEPVLSSDPDGDVVSVTVSDGPLGFAPVLNPRGRVTGFSWEPTEPGEWTVQVIASDSSGESVNAEILLQARNPRSRDLVLAMGDAIAVGFGRDRSDFLGTDECFRSEDVAYGLQAAEQLTLVGALSEEGDAFLVGCSGATTESLETEAMLATRADGSVVDEPQRSQIAWATELNPTIITLTIGAQDIGLYDPERVAALVETAPQDPEGGAALEAVEQQLASVLSTLLTTTDAHIALTTYFDPTATEPAGIDGCSGVCFSAAYSRWVDALNERIEASVLQAQAGRVSLVRLDGDNDVWEAGNPTGPDILRDLGPLDGLVDRVTGGGAATCATSGTPDLDLVSGLDCVHPNGDGHGRITELVVDVLLSI